MSKVQSNADIGKLPTNENVENEEKKVVRVRTHVLTNNPGENVKDIAAYRLGNAVKGIGTFGQCFGKNYDWTEEQIVKAEVYLADAVADAIDNIRAGKRIAAAGIVL